MSELRSLLVDYKTRYWSLTISEKICKKIQKFLNFHTTPPKKEMGYHTSVWIQVLCWLMREGEIDTFSRRTQIISIHPWSNIHYTLIKQSSLYSHHSWWVCLLLFYNTIPLWLLHHFKRWTWYSAPNLNMHLPTCLWYSSFL